MLFFTVLMKKKSSYLLTLMLVLGIVSCTKPSQNLTTESTKVALRQVGHKLLLANQDSTSRVLPVTNPKPLEYNIAFEDRLAIDPDTLVTSVRKAFKEMSLVTNYILEVIQCDDNQVAYSYQMQEEIVKGIVPCGGRILPKNCYTIKVSFIESEIVSEDNSATWYIIVISSILFIVYGFYRLKRPVKLKQDSKELVILGDFAFYPEQHKLVKQAKEISLSRKECELLELFVAKPNEIISREELTKKVWEDNGVIVGRSLDTYVSKLRKKLQEDPNIKLTNIHGVGYKLEILE